MPVRQQRSADQWSTVLLSCRVAASGNGRARAILGKTEEPWRGVARRRGGYRMVVESSGGC